jgi:hypothetical protein
MKYAQYHSRENYHYKGTLGTLNNFLMSMSFRKRYIITTD